MNRLILTATLLALASPALADGDPEKGEKVFRKCQACHAVGEGASNKVGPELNGIVGRPAGSIGDFKYSSGMQEAAAGGLVWTPEHIAEFLTKPKDFVKGTKMTFAGLRKDDEREDVIAYLSTFK
ncbi:cytochrome c family protein (plasmid) [Paroceanicella profunda]|uniref:Cytochrome c family protein n=1 Tax=Paroceanicella profunda TaxID=2579971 RepID=A0A5B8G3P6_9RHOB|nr:cytochrome c family protein [Paroceanicella profunda]QDL93912.1 cytochrome c family protein [Paroceanicella profunda]